MRETGGGTAAPTDRRQPPPTPEGEPVVRAEGVWKVFGPHGDKLIGTPECELPRGELREKTGCVVAVRDVSIEIQPGEVSWSWASPARASPRLSGR